MSRLYATDRADAIRVVADLKAQAASMLRFGYVASAVALHDRAQRIALRWGVL